MTIGEWLHAAQAALRESGSPDPAPDAEWILQWALETNRVQLMLHVAQPISEKPLAKAEYALQRRRRGEPLQYVLGEAWFYGRRFRCDMRALIPRQDTEILCEAAIAHIWPGKRSVLDLCTGSGILAVTIALERPLCCVTATDISEQALTLAEENAIALGVHVRFAQGDLFAAIGDEKFDAIVSNPPYLTADEMRSLQRELQYEPAIALLGGEDGLAFYRRIVKEAPAHLKKGGVLLLEIGSSQAEDVRALLCEHLPGAVIGVERDLQGMDRVVWAHW